MNTNKTAIIIVGVPCSGKTIICNKLSKDLGINLINENNSGNLFGILNNLHNQTESVIIEHSDILSYIDEIKINFNKVIIIYLDVSDELLSYNYNERIKNNSIGDFKNVDIFKMKKENELLINKNKFKNMFLIEINSIFDYDKGYEIIKQIIDKETN